MMDWTRFNELVALSESGKVDEAISGLQNLADSADNSADEAGILAILGACQKEAGRLDEAKQTLDQARSLADTASWVHPRGLFFEALIDVRQGNWRAVLKILDKIIESYASFLDDPENQDLRQEVDRYRGIALYELDKNRDALPLLEAAATLEYDKPRTLYYLGRCRYDLGDTNGAAESLRRALSLDLRSLYQPSAHYILGLCYHRQGQAARAVQEFEWCLQHDEKGLVPKWKVLTALINALSALGQDQQADQYSKILQDTPRS
jgi:tetratricopeptide (TPR) repeat protein